MKKSLAKKISMCMSVATLLFIFMVMLPVTSVKAPTTTVSVINPSTGLSQFLFPPNTPPGTQFTVNITITDVSNLAGWQLNVTYDPLLIKVNTPTDLSLPADHIFAGLDPLGPSRVVDNTKGFFYWARAIGPDSPSPTFAGSGRIAQVKFTTVKNGTGDPISCSISFDLVSSFPTKFVTPPPIASISFTPQNGFVSVPEFSTGILPLLLLAVTLLAFTFGKVARSKRWHRPIAK